MYCDVHVYMYYNITVPAMYCDVHVHVYMYYNITVPAMYCDVHVHCTCT